ncbi:3835_t:CDS:2 [Dentiscutata erythropus]|uniref:3835_t:CDS:1 n=1 Tax=Dentiscutata erythropus TaxID=1348616 RepID=A0A9N9H4N1_9GLOM|nr:3835_t:CDS:2 [Dentiscutata erythropus]
MILFEKIRKDVSKTIELLEVLKATHIKNQEEMIFNTTNENNSMIPLPDLLGPTSIEVDKKKGLYRD